MLSRQLNRRAQLEGGGGFWLTGNAKRLDDLWYDQSCQVEVKGHPPIEVCYTANEIPYLSNSHLDKILDSRARELSSSGFQPIYISIFHINRWYNCRIYIFPLALAVILKSQFVVPASFFRFKDVNAKQLLFINFILHEILRFSCFSKGHIHQN